MIIQEITESYDVASNRTNYENKLQIVIKHICEVMRPSETQRENLATLFIVSIMDSTNVLVANLKPLLYIGNYGQVGSELYPFKLPYNYVLFSLKATFSKQQAHVD